MVDCTSTGLQILQMDIHNSLSTDKQLRSFIRQKEYCRAPAVLPNTHALLIG
jgi:hypothetical protein